MTASSSKKGRSIVSGSKREPLHHAQSTGAVPDDERFEVTVRVRRKRPLDALAQTGTLSDQLPGERQYLTREKFATEHGSDPADISKIEAFAHEYGLIVVESSVDRRSVFLSGTASQFAEAFGAKIENFEHEGGAYRGRVGELTVPSELAEVVEGVFGIDNRPVAKPHFQRHRLLPSFGIQDHATAQSFTPPQLAQVYEFPPGLDGSGQSIAIIELGGGYRLGDIKTYFQKLGLPVPKVKTVRVDGGHNSPSTSDSADGEVLLDIEVAAGVAPKAQIVVYFAPNTDKGFLDAITKAIHDNVNKPSVISISWGGPEASWTKQSLTSYDQAFQAAAALGITITVAAGDNGSADGVKDGKAHVDFPASSPYVLATGGTKLVAAGNAIASEVVWNENPNSATGGGVSEFFPVPAYQNQVALPAPVNPGAKKGRGVPDVAGVADPQTGYVVRVDGQDFVIGGTSAVAPLWAGLIARLNQKLGQPVGFLNPIIYRSTVGKVAFNDITSGNNGAYSAGTGWDATTGWGSPIGLKLLQALSGAGAGGAGAS
jgi:kumamolisin